MRSGGGEMGGADGVFAGEADEIVLVVIGESETSWGTTWPTLMIRSHFCFMSMELR